MSARAGLLTVRQQIGIATAALCLLLVAVLAGGAAVMSARQTAALVRHEMTALALQLSDRMDQLMGIRHRDMGMLAGLESHRDLWSAEPARLRGVLQAMRKAHPEFAWLAFATADGMIRAASDGPEGVSVAAQPWFENGMHGAAVHDLRSAAVPDPAAPSGEPLAALAVPVRDPDGRAIGVLGAHLTGEFAEALRRELLATARPGSQLFVLAADGKPLLGAAPGTPALADGDIAPLRRNETDTTVDPASGDAMVTGHAMTDGYMEFPGLGWIVVARRPLLGALQAAREIVWMILALGTAVALLGLWLAIRLADRLSAPLRALAAEADCLGRAAGPVSLSHHAGSVEVVRLSTTLRSLVRRLGSAERQTQEAEQRASDVAGRLAADIRRLRQLADTDPLTGLLNRRAFLAAGNAAMAGAGPGGEGGEVAGVLLIDIDRFKQVNDRHGHAAGDAVIRQVGRLIGRSLRASDRVARFGGEEFVVLLGGTADALELAALIRQTVAATPVAHGEVRIAVTVSIGVALPAARDRDIEDTIERADRGLYAAKNAGRDRVVLMPAEGPLPRVA